MVLLFAVVVVVFEVDASSVVHPQWDIFSYLFFFCFSFCYFEEVNSLKFAKTSKTKRKTEQKTSRYMRLVSPDLQRTRTGCLTVISVDIISNFYSQFWLTQIYDLWSCFFTIFLLGKSSLYFPFLMSKCTKKLPKISLLCLTNMFSSYYFYLFFFYFWFCEWNDDVFSVFFFFAMLIHRLV